MHRSRCSGAAVTAAFLVATVLSASPAHPVEPADFVAGGSINQVYTYGHEPGVRVTLHSPDGEVIQAGITDLQGALLFKEVDRGTGYRIATSTGERAPLTVTDPGEHPPDAHYAALPHLELSNGARGGYGYLPTRDGTTLSVNVLLPSGEGPWPVVVNYTGYESSDPAAIPPETVPYLLLGYAVVGVNIRGTGCSGGAFDFFEPPQWTDGYDVIETVAQQPWSNGDVGMVGVSYGGYSQLYVGATQPPHLRALTVLSPYDDTYRSILYPGGILNDGFALEWAGERADSTRPGGADWAVRRIEAGDGQCAENQLLRLQNRDLLGSIEAQRFMTEELAYLNTKTFVERIEVPTYLAAQFQDEQTGGHAATLYGLFDPDVEVQATFTNGTHVEPVGPTEFVRSMAFIEFYVGRRIPRRPDTITALLPGALADFFGADPGDMALPPNEWADLTDYDRALRLFERLPPVRIRWETGGVPGKENLPLSATATHHRGWPVPGTVAEVHHLQPDGRLGPVAPPLASTVARSRSSYRYDPSTKADRMFDGRREAMWLRHPDVRWDPLPEGDALSFLTEPFTETVAYAGTGSVDLWLRSNATDTDIEATLTEVRPDGSEVYVQSGWLRASHRRLDPERSTDLLPHHTHLEDDAAPLPSGAFEPVRIEIFPFAHVVRPGSRLRLNLEAPSGNQPFWSFRTLDPVPADGRDEVRNEIGHATRLPSRVVLPRLPDDARPAVAETPPACALAGVTSQMVSLRNQPCRPYVAPPIPTDVTASRLPDGNLAVTWQPPPGPDEPTGYKVRTLPTGEVIEVSAGATTAVVVGPEPEVRYEFAVRARYGDRLGPESDASPLVKVGS